MNVLPRRTTVLAALLVFGVDRLVDVPEIRLMMTALGLLVVLLFLPGGFAGPIEELTGLPVHPQPDRYLSITGSLFEVAVAGEPGHSTTAAVSCERGSLSALTASERVLTWASVSWS